MTESIKTFRQEMQEELKAILSYWSLNMVDHQHGGFYGKRDFYNQLDSSADKAIILNTRILWTFSAASKYLSDPSIRQIAQRAYTYIMDHFWDGTYGGLYWMVRNTGKVVEPKKQIYAQAFGIYAMVAYYELSKSDRALSCAKNLFELIEQHSHDLKKGGYVEAFGQDWGPLADVRLSEKDMNATKTMNTHLHILEAYTALYKSWPNPVVEQAVRTLIQYFLTYFISERDWHLQLFFDDDWNPAQPIVSYGHDIECSWLLYEAANTIGDKNLVEEVAAVAIEMAQVSHSEGLDMDGSMINETTAAEIDRDRHWWPQAEAVVGFWNAYELTGDEKFRQAAMDCWKFIKHYLRDELHGEWHWRLDAAGKLNATEDKAGPWKAPYHNGRMCMEIIQRISP